MAARSVFVGLGQTVRENENEQRQPRISRDVVVECKTDKEFVARLLDLSNSGCLIMVDHLEEIAAPITLSVIIPAAEPEVYFDEERAMTGMAAVFARGQAQRLRGQLPSLGIQSIELPGSVVRQEKAGEHFALGIRFKWLSRKQRNELADYLATLPQAPARRAARATEGVQPLFRVAEKVTTPESADGEATTEAAEMTKIRFSASGPVDTGPISADEANEWLSDIDERDLAFLLLLRAMRRRASYACLFVVKGSTAHGRMAIEEDTFDTSNIRNFSIPLTPHSPFHQVFETGTFFVGPLVAEDSKIAEVIKGLGGGASPSSALLVPVVIRDRVVAIALAHSYSTGFPVMRVPELLTVADATADAACRYLRRIRDEAPDETAYVGVQAGGSAGRRSAPSAEMVEIFARLESGSSDMFEAACRDALARKQDTLTHLERHFPGKLTLPRDTELRRGAEEHGPTLALITRLKEAAAPLLATKMGEADSDLRYFALTCALALRLPSLATSVAERLVDDDPQIRELAIEVLRDYDTEDRDHALAITRTALSHRDESSFWIANALANLGDTQAAPLLLEASLASKDEQTKAAMRNALIRLTCQDFGNSERKWRRWLTQNAERSHSDWLLDGLAHKKAEVRGHAHEAIQLLSQNDFGFDPRGSGRTRADALAKCRAWLDENSKPSREGD